MCILLHYISYIYIYTYIFLSPFIARDKHLRDCPAAMNWAIPRIFSRQSFHGKSSGKGLRPKGAEGIVGSTPRPLGCAVYPGVSLHCGAPVDVAFVEL